MQNQPTMPSFLGLSDLNQKIWGGGELWSLHAASSLSDILFKKKHFFIHVLTPHHSQ
jgi:hypothetical protein